MYYHDTGGPHTWARWWEMFTEALLLATAFIR